MKLATCEIKGPKKGRRFVAAVLPGELFIDLSAAHEAFRDELPKSVRDTELPSTMIEFLEGGDETLSAARAIVETISGKHTPNAAMRGPKGQQLIYTRNDIFLHAPVPRPGKIIHTSCNFDQHLAEISKSWQAPEWQAHGWNKFHFEHPTGFLQAPSSVVGPDSPVIIPRFTEQLDYELEIATVIGRRGKYIPLDRAMDYVAGFTVFNDISARDIQAREHANKVILLGKSFDTSAPLGPYLVTKDEFNDPRDIKMELRVNGDLRQKASTADMHYGIRELVSWWSNITLEPGDVITSGSPPGVAASRGPNAYLKPGDKIEAVIEGIGTLQNIVAAEESVPGANTLY